jgi:hypothetical protein
VQRNVLEYRWLEAKFRAFDGRASGDKDKGTLGRFRRWSGGLASVGGEISESLQGPN